MTNITKNSEVSLEALAEIASCSKSWLTKLARDGYFKSERRGYYRKDNVIAGLLKHAKESNKPAPTPAMTKYHEARARQTEQRTAIEARKLISFEEHLAIFDIVLGTLKSRIESVPAQVTRDIQLRRKFEAALSDAFKWCSDRFAQMSKEPEVDKEDEENQQ